MPSQPTAAIHGEGAGRLRRATMQVEIELEDPKDEYLPGDTVAGFARVRGGMRDGVRGKRGGGACPDAMLEVLCGWRIYDDESTDEDRGVTTADDYRERFLSTGGTPPGPGPGRARGLSRLSRPGPYGLAFELGTLKPGEVREEEFAFRVPEGPFTWKGRLLAVDWVVEAWAGNDDGGVRAVRAFRVVPGDFRGPHQGAVARALPEGPLEHRAGRPSGAETAWRTGLYGIFTAGFGFVSCWMGLWSLEDWREGLLLDALGSSALALAFLVPAAAAGYAAAAEAWAWFARGVLSATIRLSSRWLARGSRLECEAELLANRFIPGLEVAATLRCVEKSGVNDRRYPDRTFTACERSVSRRVGDGEAGVPASVSLSLEVPANAPLSAAGGAFPACEVAWTVAVRIRALGLLLMEEELPLAVHL